MGRVLASRLSTARTRTRVLPTQSTQSPSIMLRGTVATPATLSGHLPPQQVPVCQHSLCKGLAHNSTDCTRCGRSPRRSDNRDIWNCDGMTFARPLKLTTPPAGRRPGMALSPPALTDEVTADALVFHCVANEC